MKKSNIRPIGPVAIALRATKAPRSVVLATWAVSAAGLAAGVVLLLT